MTDQITHIYAETLNALDEMQQSYVYAARKHVLADAERIIVDLQQRLDAVTQERDALLSGVVTEELLRRHDGFIHIKNGCSIVRTQDWEERRHPSQSVP